MVTPAVDGIDLFKIAGRSISGWIPSFKAGAASPTRQPFCSPLEERRLKRMFAKTQSLIVRELKKKDAERLFQIAREPSTYRFMPNYSDGYETPQDYLDDPNWFQEQDDSRDLFRGRYYAVALPDSDEIIGVVARGLKETLNEIEIGYFISEKHRRKGFAEEAVNALVDWCFGISDIPYVIATISCDNVPSNKLIEKCKFQLLDKRTPIKHGQLMENESYFYYRRYRI
jgi:[ribosomal protein S5]-alanine N-acetyltransferase